MNSIFTQNYTNYFVIIFDDGSTDGSDIIYKKYFDFYKIPEDRYFFVRNDKQKFALPNILFSNYVYCSPDSILFDVSADDELVGKNVLKIFNAQYQKHNAGMLYSGSIHYFNKDQIYQRPSFDYTDE